MVCFVCLLTYLLVCSSVCPSVCLSVKLRFAYVTDRLLVCLCACVHVCVIVSWFVRVSAGLHVRVCLPKGMPAYLLVCRHVRMYVHAYVCVFVRWCGCLFRCLFANVYVFACK